MQFIAQIEGKGETSICHFIVSLLKEQQLERHVSKNGCKPLDERTGERGWRKRCQDKKYVENISYQVIISQFIVSVCFLIHLHVNLLYTLEYRVPNNCPSRLLIISKSSPPPIAIQTPLILQSENLNSVPLESVHCNVQQITNHVQQWNE